MVPDKANSESAIHVNVFHSEKLFEEALVPKAHCCSPTPPGIDGNVRVLEIRSYQ